MIQTISPSRAKFFQHLLHSMYCDRRAQFKDRLQWSAVKSNACGEERDEYDDVRPTYIVYEGPTGVHAGSLRLMPTLGPTMIFDHFSDLLEGSELPSASTWECTRFCLSPNLSGVSPKVVSTALMLAACRHCLQKDIHKILAVFDPRMIRIYRTVGWAPEVLQMSVSQGSLIYSGVWTPSQAIERDLSQRLTRLERSNVAQEPKETSLVRRTLKGFNEAVGLGRNLGFKAFP